MTDSVQHVWVIPADPDDLAPLPALKRNGTLTTFAVYNRKEKAFGMFSPLFSETYDTFDECRAAMIDARVEQLDQARERARHLANTIEHIRTIPATPFPSDALQHNLQQQQEEAVQEEAQAEEVKPAKAELKRPSRRG